MRSAPYLGIVGNLNADLWIGPVKRFPQWDEELIVTSARVELAGTAGYVMHACRALGSDAYTVSTLGDDVFGRAVLRAVSELGFTTDGVDVLAGMETALGMIFIDPSGRRSILATLGAHSEMSLDVVAAHDEAAAQFDTILLCGVYSFPKLTPADMAPYASRARERGQVVAFDPSWDPSGWSERTRRDTFTLLSEVDVYLPNESELTHLTGRSDWREALRDVESLAAEVVLKRGALGAVQTPGGAWTEVPAFPVNAVNTVGAGDVFDTAYLYALWQGWEVERRLEFACAFAAMVVSQPGDRTYPSQADVESFIETSGRAGAATTRAPGAP
ncbi:MAG: carbohydrate kinase family protein [Chloroflexia bacterium]